MLENVVFTDGAAVGWDIGGGWVDGTVLGWAYALRPETGVFFAEMGAD